MGGGRGREEWSLACSRRMQPARACDPLHDRLTSLAAASETSSRLSGFLASAIREEIGLRLGLSLSAALEAMLMPALGLELGADRRSLGLEPYADLGGLRSFADSGAVGGATSGATGGDGAGGVGAGGASTED